MNLKKNLKTRMARGDNLAMLRDSAARLMSSTPTLTLAELIALDQSNRPHIDALIHEYVHTPKPAPEFEEQLWRTVETYLRQLDGAYFRGLQDITLSEDAELANRVLQLRVAALGLLGQSHYLRYLPLPENFWLEIHAVYQMAEQVKEIGAVGTSCDSSYLQVLMLGTINRTNMLKWEIALVNNWLEIWCRELSLAMEYDETQHLFFVDLIEDRGARRMRDFVPSASCRHWHVDSLVTSLQAMRQQLKGNILPPEFTEKTSVRNALGLVEQLLAEWSHSDYRRQRRHEEREGVSKCALVAHGIYNVCQHVKNLPFVRVPVAVRLHEASLVKPGQLDANHWMIENESTFGFGAVVKFDLNLWLKPGCLIALDYEFNPDLTVVGVVRSIQQQFEDECYVGIEVFSHMPSYVKMVHLANADIDTVSGEAQVFSALYLAKDDDRGLAASVVMPVLEYRESGFYEINLQQRAYHLQLGDIIEQRDDWMRAGLRII